MAVLIFKALENCNSNCVYCDVIKKHKTHILGYDLLELIFTRINEYLLENTQEDFSFTWHGGEVCMLGAEYFERALYLQETICDKTKHRINHLVQSNITLINQDIIDVFKKLGIDSIGSSFDPLHGIRGFGPERDSKSYMKLFFKGYDLLQKNNLRVGIIYVVHKQSLLNPLETVQFLTNFNTSSGIQFSKAYIYHEDKHNLALSMEEYAHFLGIVFKEWYKKQSIYPAITPFTGFINSAKSGQCSMSCTLSGKCAKNWINITPEGMTSQCGRTGDFELVQLGSIKDKTFKELFDAPFKNQIEARRNLLLNSSCKACRFWMVCHGGCPLDAYMQHGDFMAKADECAWIKTFLTEYFEPITGFKF
ncbi:MAG: radical SAM protein [Bacteroidales bacterium]|nr:radical SAM protein [Bacteroidales bacterium]